MYVNGVFKVADNRRSPLPVNLVVVKRKCWHTFSRGLWKSALVIMVGIARNITFYAQVSRVHCLCFSVCSGVIFKLIEGTRSVTFVAAKWHGANTELLLLNSIFTAFFLSATIGSSSIRTAGEKKDSGGGGGRRGGA